MNFKSVLNDVCCDNRIKNGVIDLKNADHVFVLQEYLENAGFDIETIVDKTAQLFEAGRFPDRQAYNKDGILVTFPNKEYRDRAINKGTHFAENPKKADTNIFVTPPEDVEQKPEEPKGNVPVDVELNKDVESEKKDSYKDRTPTEKVADAKAVDYILTGETPLVNYSVDEAKRFGFYNKGLTWYDTDGNLIGEQIFDETNNKPFIKKIKNEGGLTSKIVSLIKKKGIVQEFLELLQILKTGSVDGKDETFKTAIYETIPLLVLYNITDFKNAKNLKGDSEKRAIDFLTSLANIRPKLEKIQNLKEKEVNIQAYDGLVAELFKIGGMGGVSLKDIYTKQGSPTDFIHASIENFYKYADIYNRKFAESDSSKQNTADIVLIYGGNKNDVYDALQKGDIENVGESISKIKSKNVYFALVSLKALSGRVGHVLTQVKSFLDTEFKISPSDEIKENKILEEGILSSIKNTFTKFFENFKIISDFIKEKYKSTIESFSSNISKFDTLVKKDIFVDLNKKIEILDKTNFKELKKIEDESLEMIENQTLEEKKSQLCGTDSAELIKPLRNNLKVYHDLLSAQNTDTVLVKKIIETANNPSVSKYFTFEYDEKELLEINKLKNNIKSTCNKLYKSSDSCVDRKVILPVFKFRANILALQYIDEMISKILKDVNLSNPDLIKENFLKLASVLSTEAIFGGNVSLPLIKYTGNKLERLGFKKEFEIKAPESMPDLKLGKLKIKLEAKTNAYLVIYLYLFFGIETDNDTVTPTYVVYELTSQSGSGFSFKIEGNEITSEI